MLTNTKTATITYFSDDREFIGYGQTGEEHTIKVTVDKGCFDIRDIAMHHMQLIADIKCWDICDVHYIASIN